MLTPGILRRCCLAVSSWSTTVVTHSGHSTHLQQPLAGLYTHSSLWSLVPPDGNVRMYQGQALARPAQHRNLRMYQDHHLIVLPAQRGPVYTETAPPSNTQLNEESRERWELDLHGMYRHEAGVAVNSFLRKHSDESRVRIITGRGLHSEKNQPVLKPHVINLISQRGLSYKVVSKGGCIDIYPKAPHLHNMGLYDLDLSLHYY
ncbi:uncharacterized protein [Procambarus clarkii]|uniref:uncharacterized protein n=1 Tax=Procambarus clarkii TaxID=6728 RepID=UPI003743E712